jgi:hypothetical protein
MNNIGNLKITTTSRREICLTRSLTPRAASRDSHDAERNHELRPPGRAARTGKQEGELNEKNHAVLVV